MWTKFVAFLEDIWPLFKNFVVSSLLSALGLAGGFWTWLAGLVVGFAVDEVEKEAMTGAQLEDQKITDDANAKKYQDDLNQGAPVAQKIGDETNILNGTSN